MVCSMRETGKRHDGQAGYAGKAQREMKLVRKGFRLRWYSPRMSCPP
jgi:hypothetical protein